MPSNIQGWNGAWSTTAVPDVPVSYNDPAYRFVATAGDDNADGTYPTPWKTIAKVNATTLEAGMTVSFNKGDSWRGTLLPGQSGTQAAPITFSSYGTGAAPKITPSILLTSATYSWTKSGGGTNEYYLRTAANGNPSGTITEPRTLFLAGVNCGVKGTLGSLADHKFGWGNGDALGYNTIYFRDDSGDPDVSGIVLEAVKITPNCRGADLRGRTGITLNGLHFYDSQYGVNGGPDYNIVDGCTFTETGECVLLDTSDNATVRNCTFETNFENVVGAWGGLAVEIGGSNIECHHNTLTGQATMGFEIYHGGVAMNNIRIHHNNCSSNLSGGFCEMAGTSPGTAAITNVYMYYNRLFNMTKFFTCHNTPYPGSNEGCLPQNIVLSNNTFVDTAVHGTRVDAMIKFMLAPRAGEFVLRNNAYYLNDYWHFVEDAVSLTNVVHSNNIYYRVHGDCNLSPSLGATEAEDDPDFTNVATGDLTLTSTSPCIEAGTDADDTTDLAGVDVGSPPDIGAYQYVD